MTWRVAEDIMLSEKEISTIPTLCHLYVYA